VLRAGPSAGVCPPRAGLGTHRSVTVTAVVPRVACSHGSTFTRGTVRPPVGGMASTGPPQTLSHERTVVTAVGSQYRAEQYNLRRTVRSANLTAAQSHTPVPEAQRRTTGVAREPRRGVGPARTFLQTPGWRREGERGRGRWGWLCTFLQTPGWREASHSTSKHAPQESPLNSLALADVRSSPYESESRCRTRSDSPCSHVIPCQSIPCHIMPCHTDAKLCHAPDVRTCLARRSLGLDKC